MEDLLNAAFVLGIVGADRNVGRIFHRDEDPFQLENREFTQIFRLKKDTVRQFIRVIEPYMNLSTRISCLSTDIKVLAALRFFSSGSYQMDIALNRYFQISQPSVSRCINEVINAANTPAVLREMIHFPETFEELIYNRDGFFNNYGIPAIGSIDCTHVAIVPPASEQARYPAEYYINRKGYHSINVQLVCDKNLYIMNVNAKYPGSSHDAYIWNGSNLRTTMKHIYRLWPNEYFHLLGDSGYPLRPWLIVPYSQPEEDSPEALFNSRFIPARTCIERCNGVLKMRFRCTRNDRVLHYSPRVASKIINTCVILHNLGIQENELYNDNYRINVTVPRNDYEYYERDNDNVAGGRAARNRIVDNFFL